MDPYNSLIDFVKLIYPNRHLSKTTLAALKVMEKMHTHSLSDLQYSVNMYKPADTVTVSSGVTGIRYSSDICKACPAPDYPKAEPQVKQGWGVAKQKEENPMASYASAQIIADTTEKDQREYARGRIRELKYAKASAFEKQFGLTDDERPATPAEFIQRITDGKYTINKEKLDKRTYSPADYIRWRDPSLVEDQAGYKAAIAKLDEAYTKAKDTIVLSPVTDLKAAIDTFEAWSLS